MSRITKSYKTRSKATSGSCSTSVSSGILQAAARKAELQCRQEALAKKAVLEKRALEVEHDIRQLEIDTEIKVEDAKLATFEKLQDSDLSGQSSSDPRNSRKMVNDWLNDDKNASGFNSTSLLLDDPIPDIGLPQPIHHSKITDQYDSMLPKKPDKHEISSPWQRTTEYHEKSPPLQHTTENYEISPPLQQTEYYQETSSPWQQTEYREISHPLQQNAEYHEMSPPLQRLEYSEGSPPLQYTARREIPPPFQYYRPMEGFGQHDSPVQWRPSMHETASARVVPKVYETMKSSNPFASYVPGTQQDANYMQTSFSRSNPFAGYMSPEPNYTTNQSMPYMQYNSGGMQQRPTTPANRTDDMTMILEKLVQNQREAALPPTQVECFDGSPMHYSQFIKNFEYAVEKNTTDDSRRLEMLINHTSGEAHDLIKNCRMIESPKDGYKTAMKLLKRDYGQPALIAAAFKNTAQRWPNIPPGDPASIRKFSIFLINLINAKNGNIDMTSLDGPEFIRDLALKLPVPIQHSWKIQVGKIRKNDGRSPTLNDFEGFINQLSRNENDPWLVGLGYQKKPSQAPNRKSAFAATVQQKTQQKPTNNNQNSGQQSNADQMKPCLYCGPGTNHKLQECRKFRSLKPKDKSRFCMEKALCFSCLKPGHMLKNCKTPAKCQSCGKRHHTALHDDSKVHDESKQVSPTKVTTGCVNGESMSTRMTILPVTITSSGNPCITTYAFMDDGCGGVFMSPELCRELNVRTKNTKLLLKTLSDETMCDTKVVLDKLQVGDVCAQNFVDLPTVYIKEMPVTATDVPKQKDLEKWDHLKDIHLPDLNRSHQKHCIPRVSLMIGNNVPAASQPTEIKTGNMGEPFAIKSILGWMVHGLVSKETHEYVSAHFCSAVQPGNQHLEELFMNYVNTDFDEIHHDETRPSVEDKKFLRIMEDTLSQESDGHYTTALPFRDKTTLMPNNRSQAEAYANNLRKRLAGNANLREQYTQFMEEIEIGGYSEKIPDDQIEPKRWIAEYLPMLQTRQKWLQPNRNLQVGDVVLVVDNSAPRNSWPMGRVEKIHVGNKGLVRSVTLKTQSATLERPVTKLCLLLEQDN